MANKYTIPITSTNTGVDVNVWNERYIYQPLKRKEFSSGSKDGKQERTVEVLNVDGKTKQTIPLENAGILFLNLVGSFC